MSVMTKQRTPQRQERRPKPPFFQRPWVVAAVFILPLLVVYGVLSV
jgi:arabinosaccharide transport system permease protein